MIRVLVVDDDGFVRWSLSQILATSPDLEVVGEAEDGDQVVAAIQRDHPDVVLMDLRMNRMDGIQAAAAVNALADPPVVLLMTALDVGPREVLQAIEAGAAGFIHKEGAPGQDLASQVKAAADGHAPLSPRITKYLVSHIASDPYRAVRAEARANLAQLTDRERQVAMLVAEGLSNAEIAQQMFVSESTVKSHLNAAMAKFAFRSRAQLAVLVARAEMAEDGPS